MSAPLDHLHQAASLCRAIVDLSKHEDAESVMVAVRESAIGAHDLIDAALRQLDPSEVGLGYLIPILRELDDASRANETSLAPRGRTS